MVFIQSPFQFLTPSPNPAPPPPPPQAYIPQPVRRSDSPIQPHGLLGHAPPTQDPGVAMYNNLNSQYFSPEPATIAADYGARMAEQAYPTTTLRQDVQGLFSDPAQALTNYVNDPVSMPASFLSMAGVPMASSLLRSMGRANVSNLGNIQAMTEMNVPGYEFGSINGDRYGIAPGLLGGRALSGVVPSWFDIDMHDQMLAHQNDINSGNIHVTDPTTQAGYNQQGQYVDQFGNIAAMGTMSDAQKLAQNNNISLNQARLALERARSTDEPLRRLLKKSKQWDYMQDDNMGADFDGRGSGGVDAGALNAATRGAMEAMGLDPDAPGDYDFSALGPDLTDMTGYGEFGGGVSGAEDDGSGGFGAGDAEDGAGGGQGY